MDEEAIIEAVLRRRGFTNVVCLDASHHFDSIPELAQVGWRPDHLYQADDVLWASDRFVGQEIPRFIVESMVDAMNEARRQYPSLMPSFLVYPGSEHTILLDACAQADVAIIALVGAQFDLLPLGSLPVPAVAAPPTYHLPIQLVRRATQLQHLDERYRTTLGEFGREYLECVEQGAFDNPNDNREEALLRNHFGRILNSADDLTGSFDLLEVLRQFETQVSPRKVRDHFFHAFHNLLLGYSVLDQAHSHFSDFAHTTMANESISIEGIWLQTALFHDIGYPLELGSTIQRLHLGEVYDIPQRTDGEALNGDIALRTKYLASGEWIAARLRLAHLWDFLHEDTAQTPWSPQVVPPDHIRAHPFDRAMHRGFLMERCHGVASCLRLVTELQVGIEQIANGDRRDLLLQEAFLAGLSIPFHHASFRSVLRENGIVELDTAPFPFASLLTFIDSIQDDRRAFEVETSGPDILQDIVVQNGVVSPVIDLTGLTDAEVRQVERKRHEALDVLQFLLPEGLAYEYPPEFLGQ